jgi:hypothetical protein
VFFDALGLKWEYEPEGFVLPSGKHYLPDFRVTIRGVVHWFEIKPGDQGENDLFTEFMAASPHEWCGAVLNDIPDPQHVKKTQGQYYEGIGSDRPFMHWGGGEGADEDGGGGGWDNNYRFCVCEKCGAVGFKFDGRSARIGCGCDIHKDSDKNYTPDHPKIVSAFAKARAARFEHDERETYA